MVVYFVKKSVYEVVKQHTNDEVYHAVIQRDTVYTES